MASELVEVPFHGDTIAAVRDGERVLVPLKRMCDNLGLDADNQRNKLKDKVWATAVMITAVAADGKDREMFCLELDCVPMWLATIDANRVRAETRDKLAIYQKEAARVLADHFLGKRRHDAEGDPLLAAIKHTYEIRRAQVEMERHVREVGHLAHDAAFKAIEAKATAKAALEMAQSNYGWYSILGWMKLQKKDITPAEAAQMGRQASAACRSRGITVRQILDPRFGSVGLYPRDVLTELFGPADLPPTS